MDDSHVLMGSKCNHLLLYNVITNQVKVVGRPPPLSRERVAQDRPSDPCGIHTIEYNPSKTLTATGGSDPTDCLILDGDLKPVHVLMVRDEMCKGIV